MKVLFIAAAVAVFSMAASATTFSEQRQLDYMQQHQDAVADYAKKNGKALPEVQDYAYGMKLDVAKLVRRSQDPRLCAVSPRLMTFEDTQGTLRTVRYAMMSQCINQNQ